MDWHSLGGERPLDSYLQEISFFLDANLDLRPALLWPEHDPAVPGFTGPAPDAVFALHVVESLTAVLHRPLEALGTPLPDGSADSSLLILQTAGTSHYTVAAPQGAEPALSFRLLSGEVLYVPAGHTLSATHAPGARQVTLTIGADHPATGSPVAPPTKAPDSSAA